MNGRCRASWIALAGLLATGCFLDRTGIPVPDAGPPDGAVVQCAGDSDCDDGLWCNGFEICGAGQCGAGSPPRCADEQACTVDVCDEAADACVRLPDHSLCADDEQCAPSAGCVPVEPCERDADCDDGFACNGAERCDSDRCVAGARPECDDGVACTLDACSESRGGCVALPDHAACPGEQVCDGATCVPPTLCDADEDCDDGNFCDGSERCVLGRCEPGVRPDCDDSVACTVDTCDEDMDACRSVPDDRACPLDQSCLPPGGCTFVGDCATAAECDDGFFCNGAEDCVGGSCVSGTAPACADSVACTADFCDEVAERCANLRDDSACAANERCDAALGCLPDCTADPDCDDGLFCNGAETCVAGGCVAGAAVDCADVVACTIDACDETNDVCRNIPDDGACGANEICLAGPGCVPECVSDGDCDDGLFCNGAETCAFGGCVAGTTVDCADAVACTTDGCDETADVCRNLPSDAACGTNERCDAMLGCLPGCTADPDCDDGLFCNGAETCVADGCVAGTPVDCADAVACTIDGCDETSDVCRNIPDDGACGTNEICLAGPGCVPECVSDGDCDDGLFCNGAETCAFGGCVAGAPVDCADAVACTIDGCDETADVCRSLPDDGACAPNETCVSGVGCVPECLADGDCDDGLYCNGAETCASGGCVAGTPIDCADAVACTFDACDEAADRCRNLPDHAECPMGEACDAALGCIECTSDPDCDDGLFCNGSETCALGRCQAGTAVDCDDAVACTVDTCDEAGDVCAWTPDDAMCATPTEVCAPPTGCVELGAGPENPGASCAALLAAGFTADGPYWIDPDGGGALTPRELSCDMTAGGWTLVLETDASGAEHLDPAAVAPSLLSTSSIDGVAKVSDAFIAALLAGGTDETWFDAPSGASAFYVRGAGWGIPYRAGYPAAIEATTSLVAGYAPGDQCYDAEGSCAADEWCVGTAGFVAEYVCVRRAGGVGMYLDGGTFSPGMALAARVYVR